MCLRLRSMSDQALASMTSVAYGLACKNASRRPLFIASGISSLHKRARTHARTQSARGQEKQSMRERRDRFASRSPASPQPQLSALRGPTPHRRPLPPGRWPPLLTRCGRTERRGAPLGRFAVRRFSGWRRLLSGLWPSPERLRVCETF